MLKWGWRTVPILYLINSFKIIGICWIGCVRLILFALLIRLILIYNPSLICLNFWMIIFIALVVFSRLSLIVILIILIMFYLVTLVWMLSTNNNNILSLRLISIVFRGMSALTSIKVILFSTPSVLIIWILMLFYVTIFMSFIMKWSTFPILIITMIVILAYLLLLIMISSVIAIFATFMKHFAIKIFWSAWFWYFIIVILWVLMFSVSLIWDVFIWIIWIPFIASTSGSMRRIVKLVVIPPLLTSPRIPTDYTSSIFFIWTFFWNHSYLTLLGFYHFTWTSII